jgi:RNA methyltransferase, TrmH family
VSGSVVRDGEAGAVSFHRSDDKLVRIAGLPSVAELFEAGANRVERLYFDGSMKAEVRAYCDILGRRRKVYRQVGDDEMRRVAGTVMHGGVVALARPRPIRELDIKMAEGWAAAGEPLLILDGIGNPQNIGAIARTAAFFGVQRLVLSDHPGQAGLSDAAYRIAKGGLERLEIYRASRLPETLRQLGRIYEVAGTAIENGKPMNMLPKNGKPTALVLGNEEDGLAPATLAACSFVVALTGSGRVQSLNVGAAAAILIHTLLSRR